jgi:hypothetical protein
LLVLALVFAGALFAQERPAENISPKLHPHLAAAQRMYNMA